MCFERVRATAWQNAQVHAKDIQHCVAEKEWKPNYSPCSGSRLLQCSCLSHVDIYWRFTSSSMFLAACSAPLDLQACYHQCLASPIGWCKCIL